MSAAHRFLLVTDGNYVSHTSRTLEIGRRLRDAGDSVVFAASGPYARMIEEAGFERLPIHTPSREHILNYTRGWRHDYFTDELLERCVEADLEALGAAAADLVVGDFRWSLSISCEIAGIPYASLLNVAWTGFYGAARSAPPSSRLGRMLGRRGTALVEPLATRVVSWAWGRPFNRYRRRAGLPARPGLLEHLYGDLVLLPDIPTLFPTTALPENFEVVGPIVWRGATTSHPQRLPSGGTRPVVYATVGSTADYLIHLLFRAFGGREVDVVLTTAGQPLPGKPPRNFRCLDFAAPDDVLPGARLAVCHGGHGTLYQCLAYGVPVLGISTSGEQHWNLDRVAAVGAGWHISAERITVEALVACLDAALGDEAPRRRAAELAREIAARDGAREAAAALRRFLARRSPA